MCPDEEISAKTVVHYLHPSSSTRETTQDNEITALYRTQNFKEAKRDFEREYLLAKLQENGNNITQTAEILGMERSHLHKKLKALHIELSASD
jgi:two-component system nitrogen regulation response regulator NtrX